jgi:signal transduction histidine kinase
LKGVAVESTRLNESSATSKPTPTAFVLQIAVVALAYLTAARIGLSFDAIAGFATLVWPPSGIAVAALLLGGYRLWPAVAIGAFAANFMAGAPVLAALGIAAGNASEALLGAYLLYRMAGFRCQLDRVRDVLALLALAAGISTLVSATVGVSVLMWTNLIPPTGYAETWKAWWIGDAIGDLIAAPLILVWAEWKPRLPRIRRLGESLGLGITLLATGYLVFRFASTNGGASRGREYMLFPPLIWAALRFGVRGAVTSSTAVAVIAIINTSLELGPFVRADMHESLLVLQTFVGITSATFLVLGASISERRKGAADLRIARETAEAANRAKSGFLAVVSHELRTPLNAITGYVELLMLELDGPLTDKQRSVLDRIRHSQRHLLSLIEDILGFAQVEAGRLSFALQPVPVREALESIETIVGRDAERRGLTIRLGETDPDLGAHADPDKLRQILLNLVTNAMKFTPADGVVTMLAVRDGQYTKISVTDTGIGISATNLSRVFDPFFQVDQGGTRKYPGVGLGLSIVRDAVLAMNGDVRIESEPGKGTKVTVSLPHAETGGRLSLQGLASSS